MINPLYRKIVADNELGETLYIHTVMSLDGEHYVVYSPLITQYDMDEILEEFDADERPYVTFVGVGRVMYDYVKLTATIEPLHEDTDFDIIDTVLSFFGYAVN